jgi:hypothetical protein
LAGVRDRQLDAVTAPVSGRRRPGRPDTALAVREAMGVIRVDTRDQLDRAMTDLCTAAGPALLHVEQDPELL